MSVTARAQPANDQLELDRIRNLYNAFLHINQVITRARTRKELFDEVCRTAVERGGFRVAFVALHDPETQQIVPVAQYGPDQNYIANLKLYGDGRPEGRGPGGQAFQNNQPQICNNFLEDSSTIPWQTQAAASGIRATAAFPICLNQVPCGIFNVYAGEVGWFRAEEISLLQGVSDNISFSLDHFAVDEQRERQEETLRRFAAIIESSSDGIISRTLDGFITSWNPGAEKIFGYSSAEIVGRSFSTLLPPDSSKEWRDVALELPSVVPWVDGETSLVRKNGQLFPASITVSPLIPPNGTVVGVATIVRDISERKRTEAALWTEILGRREMESTQSAILNALPAHIALIDSEALIISVNDSWRRFGEENGIEPRLSGVGRNYLEVCKKATLGNPEEAAQAASGVRAVLAGTSTDFRMEYSCDFPGQQRWFEMLVSPIQTQESTGAVIMHIDITAQKLAAQKLRDSQERSLLLLNSTAEGICGMDSEGHCAFSNEAAARLLGYERPQDMVGTATHERHHHTRRDQSPYPRNECKIYVSLKSGEPIHADDELFFRLDGTSFPVEYRCHPVRDGKQIVGSVITFLDITERRNLEAQFLQAQKMEAVGRMAGGIAHDFNNALGVVAGYGQLLEQRMENDDTGKEYARQIRKAQERAASLTRQLLAFSRKQLLRPKALNLGGVVRGIQEMLGRMVGEDVRLKISIQDNLPAVKADRAQIEQILMNLAVNAKDAMPTGGELHIRTSTSTVAPEDLLKHSFLAPGEYVVLSVRDTGTGIDSETLAHIFEPFFTTKEAGRGTGLGLSTVYGIVKQSGGNICASSEPGEGTTFEIYLPESKEIPEPEVISDPVSTTVRGTETILVVEDDEFLRELICDSLAANGYKVLRASDGKSGIELASSYQGDIDLLLTDVILPGKNGRMVADAIRSSHKSARVLYMSGYTDEKIACPGDEGTEIMLLEKPFGIDSLLLHVRDAVDRKAA